MELTEGPSADPLQHRGRPTGNVSKGKKNNLTSGPSQKTSNSLETVEQRKILAGTSLETVGTKAANPGRGCMKPQRQEGAGCL